MHLFQWMRTLEKQLAAIDTPTLKPIQSETEKRLIAVLQSHKPSRPVRELLGRCLLAMYSRGDTRSLAETITTCQAILKAPPSKDPKKDAPLQLRLYVPSSPVIPPPPPPSPRRLCTHRTADWQRPRRQTECCRRA